MPFILRYSYAVRQLRGQQCADVCLELQAASHVWLVADVVCQRVALVRHRVLGALATWQARVGGGVDDGAVAALGDPQRDGVVVELDLAVGEYAK